MYIPEKWNFWRQKFFTSMVPVKLIWCRRVTKMPFGYSFLEDSKTSIKGALHTFLVVVQGEA